MAKITFWGAARQVTGSMFLMEINGYKLLIDCGFDMETLRKNHFNQAAMPVFPFDPKEVDCVVITHAHIDHSGNIPNLYRSGYQGKVYCTSATKDLTLLLLKDSAGIHERKLAALKKAIRGKKNRRKKVVAVNPPPGYYLNEHVETALEHVEVLSTKKTLVPFEGASISLVHAGHLLGAVNVRVEFSEGGKTKSILFSGDIGRKNYPLLLDPKPNKPADYVVCETTYGNRLHKSRSAVAEELEEIITQTCIKQGGKLIIPAFSVGRSQAILFVMSKLWEEGKLPPIPVYADSPLAFSSNNVYNRHVNEMSDEAKTYYKAHKTLFGFQNLFYVKSAKESKALSSSPESCIIVSSSGMLDAGRIQLHVRNNLDDANSTILMIGFCAEGTFGYDLLHAKGSVRFDNKDINVKAKVLQTDVLSGHGDLNDLLSFFEPHKPEKTEKVFLVHGEYESMCEFQKTLQEKGYPQVLIPEKGQEFEI
jgi:metallo-beta-lactamase family protein